MTDGDFSRQAEHIWEAASEEAAVQKDPYLVPDRLHRWYGGLSPADRLNADEVVARWALSETEAKRFDAVTLVRDFRITSAVPALRELSRRLEGSSDPGAPFERDKVDSLAAELSWSV